MVSQQLRENLLRHGNAGGYSLPCPNCERSTTAFLLLEDGWAWYCWTCDIEFQQEDTIEYEFVGG